MQFDLKMANGDSISNPVFAIYNDNIIDGQGCASGKSTIYNPTNVDSNNYHCQIVNQHQCYLGDLSSRFEPMAIPTSPTTSKIHDKLLIDISELFGLSFMIEAGGNTYCANIVPYAFPATGAPTTSPTDSPTHGPTVTGATTKLHTDDPTKQPTQNPTENPTDEPTDDPTEDPTEQPTEPPVEDEDPTKQATDSPVEDGTQAPVQNKNTEVSYTNVFSNWKEEHCDSLPLLKTFIAEIHDVDKGDVTLESLAGCENSSTSRRRLADGRLKAKIMTDETKAGAIFESLKASNVFIEKWEKDTQDSSVWTNTFDGVELTDIENVSVTKKGGEIVCPGGSFEDSCDCDSQCSASVCSCAAAQACCAEEDTNTNTGDEDTEEADARTNVQSAEKEDNNLVMYIIIGICGFVLLCCAVGMFIYGQGTKSKASFRDETKRGGHKPKQQHRRHNFESMHNSSSDVPVSEVEGIENEKYRKKRRNSLDEYSHDFKPLVASKNRHKKKRKRNMVSKHRKDTSLGDTSSFVDFEPIDLSKKKRKHGKHGKGKRKPPIPSLSYTSEDISPEENSSKDWNIEYIKKTKGRHSKRQPSTTVDMTSSS